MPIAAIPVYIPDKLLAEASPGLRFGMYLKLWDANYGILPDNKRAALDEACKLTQTDRRTMQALARRQRDLADPLVASGALLRLEAVAVAPFTTGLGNEHPLENGFAFLNPYGLPYLPGSGIKGVVRQAARELASGEWGETGGWIRDESYSLKIGKEEIRLSLLDVLFGWETPGGESEHVRGALSFWDVIPQIAGERLAVEVMTPHQTHYYQNGETPHESGSPNPITFLTVPPKSRFDFHVLCDLAHLRRLAPALAEDGRWKGLVEAAFAHAFQWLGFGAKTAVGYGTFAVASGHITIGGQTSETGLAETPGAPASETPSETVWERARLQYNPQNRTLTAISPDNSRANAFDEQAQELLSRLPEEVRQKVRTNQFVRVIAHVRGHELIAVEAKP
jgi:CRISPR-associated protein Cmr6